MGGGPINGRGAYKWEGGQQMVGGLINGRGPNNWEEGL